MYLSYLGATYEDAVAALTPPIEQAYGLPLGSLPPSTIECVRRALFEGLHDKTPDQILADLAAYPYEAILAAQQELLHRCPLPPPPPPAPPAAPAPPSAAPAPRAGGPEPAPWPRDGGGRVRGEPSLLEQFGLPSTVAGIPTVLLLLGLAFFLLRK